MVPVAQAKHGDDLTAPHGAVIVSTLASSGVRPDDRAGLRGADDAVIGLVSRPDDRAGVRGADDAVIGLVSRPDDRAGVRGPSTAPVHFAGVATSDGFDWIDALIGGVGGVATALLIMGGAFLLLSQRNRTRTA